MEQIVPKLTYREQQLVPFRNFRNNCSYWQVPFYNSCSFSLACGTFVPNCFFFFLLREQIVPKLTYREQQLVPFRNFRNNCSYWQVPFYNSCSFSLACGTFVPNCFFFFLLMEQIVPKSTYREQQLVPFCNLRNKCSY